MTTPVIDRLGSRTSGVPVAAGRREFETTSTLVTPHTQKKGKRKGAVPNRTMRKSGKRSTSRSGSTEKRSAASVPKEQSQQPTLSAEDRRAALEQLELESMMLEKQKQILIQKVEIKRLEKELQEN